mgnify:CR=1 FL=1
MSRFGWLCIALTAACFASLAGLVAAQPYPARPVKIVVPYPAGGTSDVLARLLAPKMAELLATNVIVENKPGAAGFIVLRCDAAGYRAFSHARPNRPRIVEIEGITHR